MENTSQFQREISDLSPKHNSPGKIIRKNLVNDIVTDLVNSKMKNGGRVPHIEFNKHFDRVKDVCSSITRSMINRDVLLHWTSLIYEDEFTVVYNEDNDTNAIFSRDRIGCPVGTMIVSKHVKELHRVKVHNDISIEYTVAYLEVL